MSVKKGRVAVITRTKDRPILLRRCIRSVLGQTYDDWLHVIVNDGGDPSSVEALLAVFSSEYRGRLLLLHNPASVGMQNASNVGIKASESDYIVIHDDDDSWAPRFLEDCVGHLDSAGTGSPEQGVVCQSNWILEEIDSSGNIVELSRRDYYPFRHVGLSQMTRRNHFPPVAFLYRRAAHDRVGYFRQEFNELGDWDFNLRFLLHYDIGVLPRSLANYHWRHQARGSGYGNTVTDGLDSHQRMAWRLQDHYLREDIASGRAGIGFLLCIGRGFEEQLGHNFTQEEGARRIAALADLLVAKSGHFERITSDLARIWRAKDFVARKAGGLRAAISRAWSRRPQAPAVRGDSAPALADALREARYLSLDVFDTVLLRVVRKPTDVFLYMEDDVRRLLARPQLRFPDLRVTAEAIARTESSSKSGSEETTLDLIYSVVARLLAIPEEQARLIMEMELAAERSLCYANPACVELIKEAVRSGKEVFFTSDMYLYGEQILDLLRHNGISGHHLHLSSEAGVSKHKGGLFSHVIAQSQCPPDKILHIGDNRHSDFLQPRKQGLLAHLLVRRAEQVPLADEVASYSGAWDRDLASSVAVGLARRHRLHRPLTAGDTGLWEKIGYEVFGPLYLAYASWILDRSLADGFRNVYFLSRDGYHLIRVFKRLCEGVDGAPKSSYLLASRRLWNVAGITELNGQAMDLLTTPNPRMRVRDFLERIGLDGEECRQLALRAAFADIDQVITTKDGVFSSDGHRAGMRALMADMADRILERAQRERDVLLRYLRDQGLFDEAGAIADIGWQGSSVASLNSLLAAGGSCNRFAGLYFGTWTFAQGPIAAGHRLESFYVDLGQPRYRADLVAESVELLESFFWAPHPTVVGLDDASGEWMPVYGEAEIESGFVSGLQLATDAAFGFVEEFLEVLPSRRRVPPSYAYLDTVFERLWRSPRREEASLLGGMGLRNSFGGRGPVRHVAKVPPLSRRTAAATLQDAYDHCYWKKGFLAQLTPAQRALVRP